MTTKQASEKFKIDQKIIANMCKMDMIPEAKKYNGKWWIPDELPFLLDIKNIQNIIYQIVNLKNNENYAYSNKEFIDIDITNQKLKYLIKIGFISCYDDSLYDIKEVILSCILTEEGIQFLFKGTNKNKNIKLNANLNINNKVALVNIG
jgi:hypothetical protein